MTTKIISLDLDSTIASTRHRWHLIDRVNGTDWDAYSAECVNDEAGPALALAQHLSLMEVPFIVVSGRSESARELTLAWLHSRGVHPWAVFLCDDRHDTMSHHEWKALRLKEIADENNWEIVLHVDDITGVAVATEAIGIPTMLVHDIEADFKDHLG